MISKIIPWLAAAALGSSAFGYGPAGHEIVGNVAGHYLKGTRAEGEVKKLLRPGESLAKAATWPDRAKFPARRVVKGNLALKPC